MDTVGAAVLRDRLEHQQHWLAAPAVQDGRLPRGDPDVAALQEIRAGERVYADVDGRFVKRLIDGAWVRSETAAGP